MSEFTLPTKCRMVLFHPSPHEETLPAIVTHVARDYVHLVVLDGSVDSILAEDKPGTYARAFVPHLSVSWDDAERARGRWEWPPRS